MAVFEQGYVERIPSKKAAAAAFLCSISEECGWCPDFGSAALLSTVFLPSAGKHDTRIYCFPARRFLSSACRYGHSGVPFGGHVRSVPECLPRTRYNGCQVPRILRTLILFRMVKSIMCGCQAGKLSDESTFQRTVNRRCRRNE